jgi:hypothetical protein
MSDDKLESQINKGAQAENLFKSEIFNEACSGVKAELLDRWEVATDGGERERIWYCVNLIERVKTMLITFGNNGKISKAELDRLLKDKARRAQQG